MKITPLPEWETAQIEQAYQEDLAAGRVMSGGESPEWFKDLYLWPLPPWSTGGRRATTPGTLYSKGMANRPQKGHIGKFISAFKRAWKWFMCDHINHCVDLEFDNSTEMRICQGCGRVLWVMDDGDRTHNPHKRDRLVI